MEQILIHALNFSISAGYLVIAILVLRLLLKKAPKWMNMVLWSLVALRLLVPFVQESDWSLLPSRQVIPTDIALSPDPGIYTGIKALDRWINPIIAQLFTPQVGASVNPLQIWLIVAAAVWLVGIAVMLLYAVVSYMRLRYKVRTAVQLRWRVYQCENIASPFVFGFFRPRIYVPYNLDEESLTYVIHHEDIHIERKDHWWKPLGYLLLSIYWFHPLMWAAYILLCRDMELACDEQVVKYQDDAYRAAYSQALLDCSVEAKPMTACPLAFGEVGVKQRIQSVLRYKKPGALLVLLTLLVCSASFLGFLTSPPETPKTWTLTREERLEAIEEIEPADIKSMTVDYDISGYTGTLELRGAQAAQVLEQLKQMPDQPKDDTFKTYMDGYMHYFSITLHSGAQFRISCNNKGEISLGGHNYTTTKDPDWLTILQPDFQETFVDFLAGLSASGVRSVDVFAFFTQGDHYVNMELPAQQIPPLLSDLAAAVDSRELQGWEYTGAEFDILCFRIWTEDQGPFVVHLGEKLSINGFLFTPGEGALADWQYYLDLLMQQ